MPAAVMTTRRRSMSPSTCASLRAQRHADPDLVAPLEDVMGQHAVDAHGRQRRRESAKNDEMKVMVRSTANASATSDVKLIAYETG